MAIKDYSATAAANVAISGIFIGEGMEPEDVNNAIRQLMADLKARFGDVIYVEDYGASTTASAAANTTAINAAIVAAAAIGGRVEFPAKNYPAGSIVVLTGPVAIDFNGATLTGPAVRISVDPAAEDVTIMAGHLVDTSNADTNYLFDVAGPDCTILEMILEKAPDAGGYIGYARNTADGFKMLSNKTRGSNGIYNEASNAKFLFNDFKGRTTGGDDAIAIKGLNDNCRNVQIIGNSFENLASGASIGSEIGTLAANDATYSRTVGQVLFTGNTMKNCYGMVYIKPGGTTLDYRDGTVEDVVISNNVLIDESGTKFERGIAIVPGRGARVRNIYGKGNIIRARSVGGAGRLVGALDIYIVSDAGGTVPASVSGVYLEIDYTDPYNGVANGVGGAPGYPVSYVASVTRAAAIGTVNDIELNIRGNGSTDAGLVVGAGLTGVRVRHLDLTAVNVNNVAGQGGVYLLSDISLGANYWSVTPAAGSEIGGTGLIQRIPYVRGAMVKKTADQIGADYSAGATIAFDAEVYDTDAIHDTVTNNSRLTVPARVRYVRCGCTVTFANLTAGVDLTVVIRKNGSSSYDGVPQQCVDAASAAPCVNLTSGSVPVVAGDYFEVVAFSPTDASSDITAARTTFWMDLLEVA